MALNQLKFDQLETGSVYPITASYALNSSGGGGGTTLTTGSTYPITSSWSNNATTASFASNSTSASYSNTASVALNSLTASYLNPISQNLIPSTGSIYSLGSPTNKWKDLYVSTGSIYIGETVLSTSGSTLFANSSPIVTLNTASGQIEVAGLTASLSASFASNANLLNNTASTVFATTGSNTFSGSQIVHGNITVNGSLFGTASVALVALTSSYNLNSVSSSYSLTASYAMNGGSGGGGTTLTTGSTYPITASWAINVVSASYALIAESATTANSSTSASYALTASFALNSIAGASGSEGGGLFVVTSDGFNYNIAGYSGTFPTITLVRGQLYYFNISGVSASHPFALRLSNGNTSAVPGTTNNDPVSGNANTSTLIIYRVPNDAPSSIVYQCTVHSSMIGTINIVNQYGTTLTTGSTYPITSSWSNNATTATSATSANSATSASFASTASYNLNSISSSYALTASFSLNGGGGGTTLTTGSTYPITSSWSNNATTASYALNASGGGGGISYITGSPVIGQYIVVSGSGTTQYILTQSVSNPEHLLVSVNGVVQNYSSSYTVTGSTLNFYQPYSDGDEIDVRFLNGNTTLQTGSIANQTILYNFSSSQESTLTGLNLTGNKWGITVVEEWNSGSGDIYYPSSSILLHFSGSNNSTTIIDNGPNNVSSTVSGGAKITASFSKFGGTSLFLGGTNGNYLTIPVVSGGPLDVNNQNFTVECYIYITATTTGMIASRYNSSAGSGNYNWDLSLTSTGKLQGLISQFNNNNSYNLITGLTTLATNTWHHIAYVKSSSLQTLFLNGNIDVSGSITITTSDSGQAIRIGTSVNSDGSTNAPITGYIDEFRITKNVVRYTGSFTTSSLEFPNQLPQYETKYIGLIGGLNDTGSDYGVQKLDDTSLKIRKMSVSGTPVSGSPSLSSSVDRVYVNVLNYDNVSISGSISNAVTSSYALTSVTSSFALSASYLIPISNNTTKAIFGYGLTSVAVSVTNLVSNTGIVANDTTGVGTARYQIAAAGYGGDKAIFGYGTNAVTMYSVTNLVNNTGVVATDTTGVGTARVALAASGYGNDKAIFGYGYTSVVVSMTNLVSNTGVVATDTTGVGTARTNLAAAGYGTDKAIFGYGFTSVNVSMTNLVSNTGVVATDTTGVGTARYDLTAAGYGTDKAIFGFGWNGSTYYSITNLVSNTGVVATDTTGVGTARYSPAAARYGGDKAIFGYGSTGTVVSMVNLVSNTGVVANDTLGVGTARRYIAAAGYSTS
jgi:hypothetical protein